MEEKSNSATRITRSLFFSRSDVIPPPPGARVMGCFSADGVAKPPGDPRMKEICHPNCVRLYAVFDEEHQNGKIYAVMELFGSCPPVAR